jgi:hypothetical protein
LGIGSAELVLKLERFIERADGEGFFSCRRAAEPRVTVAASLLRTAMQEVHPLCTFSRGNYYLSV